MKCECKGLATSIQAGTTTWMGTSCARAPCSGPRLCQACITVGLLSLSHPAPHSFLSQVGIPKKLSECLLPENSIFDDVLHQAPHHRPSVCFIPGPLPSIQSSHWKMAGPSSRSCHCQAQGDMEGLPPPARSLSMRQY